MTWSTLVQLMAFCLTAPSHYLNYCWIIISEVLWPSHEGSFTGNAQDISSLIITNPRFPGINEFTIDAQQSTIVRHTQVCNGHTNHIVTIKVNASFGIILTMVNMMPDDALTSIMTWLVWLLQWWYFYSAWKFKLLTLPVSCKGYTSQI